jgi:capsular polysaccharide biosynthesis protein
MELKEIVKNLKKHNKILFLSAVVGILCGYLVYLAPKPYYATGSFYIKRAVDSTKFKYFTYEGYYAQQTGLSYTNNVLALLESLDIRKEAMENLNLPTDTINLRKYSSMIRVKKSGPQIITLTVKGKTPTQAEGLWNSIANTAISKNEKININGDPLLSISRVSESPVVRDQSKPLWLCLVVGFVFIPSFLIVGISLREYFKWK